MKITMKKTLSFTLALVFVLSAFGAATLFSGVIGAGAVFYDYYTYTPLPGWSEFTPADLTELHNPGATVSQDGVPDFAPDSVENATKFVITNSKPGTYEGIVDVGSYINYNLGEINSDGNPINAQWSAKGTPSSGATFNGGHDFSDDSGFCFWIAQNGAPASFAVKINIFAVPCCGPYGEETPAGEDTIGFVYEAKETPDSDGYVYFDFKTDFYQVDWYWKDDEGQNHTCLGGDETRRPLPYNMIHLISGITVTLNWAHVDDVYYIGDFRAYKDSRIHFDELSEAIDAFDALDPEAYVEESYAEVTEVYLEAYEMLLNEDTVTQKEVDTMAKSLLNAIKGLKPLFPVKASEVKLNGFDIWDDNDLETITDGGISLDPAVTAPGVGPDSCDHAIEIVANGDSTYIEPYYGWSCFTSIIDQDGETVAVKNPFGADMNETNGISFWLQNPDDIVPNAMQINVGKAGEVEFVADDYSISRPLTAGGSGYVSVSWNSFYDSEGDRDIYDYLDSLDYIGILFEDLRQIPYFVSDLHAFCWSEQNADTSELKQLLFDVRSYVSELDPNAYVPITWEKLTSAITNAEKLLTVYGVTQEEIDDAAYELNSRLNKLTLIGNNANLDQLEHLYALIKCGQNYWRGNYTSQSYAVLNSTIAEAIELSDGAISKDACDTICSKLESAIAGLVPITNSGHIENGFFSLENFTSRDFSKATGDRTEGVNYSLVKRAAAPFLPNGFDQALQMEIVQDINDGESSTIIFKSMYRNAAGSPIFITPSNGKPLVGDLTGSSGLKLWVGVNDVSLVQDLTFRVGVSNCDIAPIFELHATDIPLPPNGSGWVYIPWEYFEWYDPTWSDSALRLNHIRFYIIDFEGIIKQGLKIYTTGMQAYTGVSTTDNVQPAFSNLSEGQQIDVSETPFIPDWNVGNALLDGKFFIYGSNININGAHTIELINGDKKQTVNFTITGGESVYAEPIVNGVENGGMYDQSVTVTWDIGTASLDGASIEKGTVVSDPGEHTLVVTNGDKQVTVVFTIKEKAPEVNKGDYDNDGEITVTDALAALRIAAKLVPETEKDIAICDTDNDGHVTVTDALAILRVAAKLAPPESIGFRHTGGFDD